MVPLPWEQAVYLMDREARVEAGKGVHVRHRVECLLKAISACHKCDLDSSQARMVLVTLDFFLAFSPVSLPPLSFWLFYLFTDKRMVDAYIYGLVKT